jgi:glucosamine--fructose-6-phosphate aminotransferase (isomerizing)
MTVPTIHSDLDGLELIETDIDRQGQTLTAAVPALRADVGAIVGRVPDRPTYVYLVGCGDSLDGGTAARFAWGHVVPCPVEAVPAMTFVTSVVQDAPEGALVVALSQSGRVSRVIEAVRAARARGLATIAITTNPMSPLAGEPADATWVIPFEKVGAVPGTTSCLLGAVALYEIGCALASDVEARDLLRDSLDGLGELVRRTVLTCAPVANEHAGAMERDLPILALGYGGAFASARHTVRKLLELAQIVAICQETEEYAHDEYSLVGPAFRVIQFCPPDRGTVRNVEVARYLRRLGVHLGVVADASASDMFRDIADVVYPVPSSPPPLAPLLHSVAGQLLSVATARRVGGSLYGMAERVHREDGDPQIYESEIAS